MFEVGKTYLTRDGCTASITSINDENGMFIGVVTTKDGIPIPKTWDRNGNAARWFPHHHDLMARNSDKSRTPKGLLNALTISPSFEHAPDICDSGYAFEIKNNSDPLIIYSVRCKSDALRVAQKIAENHPSTLRYVTSSAIWS